MNKKQIINICIKFQRLDPAIVTFLLLSFSLITYWIGVFRQIELPGLYMDAINPDYLAAKILNPGQNNPVWVLPTKWFPILGNLYHGVQNLYFGLPFFWLFGTNIVTARIVHAAYGAIIVVLVFYIVLRATRNRWVAAISAICLSTDIAFIASFRTQNYIILGGVVWLFVSILFIVGNREISLSRKKILASGIFFGLAVYAYFVFSFFFPVFIYGIAQTAAVGRRSRCVLTWCVGVIIGMVPYVLGYLSMGLALGGWRELLVYVNRASQDLAPFSSKLSFIGGYGYALDAVKLAVTNAGNELMIFGEVISTGLWGIAKFNFFVGTIVLFIIWLFIETRLRAVGKNFGALIIVLLPISYFAFSGMLGQRLWAHHFSVMTPFIYLIGGVVFHKIYRLANASCPAAQVRCTFLSKFIVAILFCAILFGNLVQQQHFFGHLDYSGGAGKMSNSLNLLSNEARSRPADTVYIFPEWGFFMPFAFLTGNKVPYRLEISDLAIDEIRGRYKWVSVAFWDGRNTDLYRSQLMAAGFDDANLRVLYRRDGEPALYLLSAPFRIVP